METDNVAQLVSTGHLPGWDDVESLVQAAYRRYSLNHDGTVADYIPVLAEIDPDLFGICVAQVDGGVLHSAGDVDTEFSIQSISKAFVYALVCEEFGHGTVRERIGVNNTGLPFNSVVAIELNDGHPMNPMVNAGAIATTALIPEPRPPKSGNGSGWACPNSQAVHWNSTGWCTSQNQKPINAIARSRGCWKAMGGWSSTRSTSSMSTRNNAHCASPPATSPSWVQLSRMAVLTRAPENTWCRPKYAVTRWRSLRRTGSMNAPASGFSKSGFRANLKLPAES